MKLISTEELDRQTLSREVSETEDFASLIINHVEDGIHAFDRKFNFILWNPGMERITGKPAKDVIGRNAFEIFPYLTSIGRDDLYAATLRGETRVGNLAPVTNLVTGTISYIRSRLTPLRDEYGTIVGGLSVVTDVTQQKLAADELSRIRLDLENLTSRLQVVANRNL